VVQSASIAAIRSSGSANGDLQEFVRECISPIQYDVTAQSAPGITFIGGVKLGGVDVFRYEGIGMRGVRRVFRHIQADGLDDLLICLPIHARANLSRYGSIVTIEPGYFMMYLAARPIVCSLHSPAPCDKFSCIHVRVSAPLLRRRVPHLDDCCDLSLAVRRGAAHIMSSMMELALSDTTHLSRLQAEQFGSMLADSIANAVGEAPEVAQRLAAGRRNSQDRIRELATRYIERNLSNSSLSCELVAEHCKVTSRYLRAIFASASTSVTSFVREMRLQQCRASLRAPALSNQSVTQIAMIWGFNDPAHFSRIYKARFHRPPSDDRGVRDPDMADSSERA